MMTFEEFQATRRGCADLRTVAPDAYEDISRGIPQGFVYAGNTVIEITNSFLGVFLLVIANRQRESSDLEQLERALYNWWCAECAEQGEEA